VTVLSNSSLKSGTVTFSLPESVQSRCILILFACICLFLLCRFFASDYDLRICRAYDSTSEYVASLVFDSTEYKGDIYHNTYARALVPTSLAYWLPGILSHYVGISLHFLSILLFLLEPFLGILSAYLVAYYLTRQPWIAFTVAILAYCGEAGYWNLGGFGYEKKYPYPPYLAYGCSFISIWYFLKERPRISAFWQIFASLIHPAIGIHLTCILGVGVLYCKFKNRNTRWLPYVIALILSVMIALIVAQLAYADIPKQYRASAAMVYSAMNQGHGAIWENEPSAILANLLGYGFYAIVFLISWQYLSRTTHAVDPKFLWLLLGSVVISAIGIFAKVVAQFAVQTSLGNLFLPFHQLLFLRASHFTLLFMLMICVWALLDMVMRADNILTIITCYLMLFRMALPWSYHLNSSSLKVHLIISTLMIGALVFGSTILWRSIGRDASTGKGLLDFIRYQIASILISLGAALYVIYSWGNKWENSHRLMLLTGIVLLLCEMDWLTNKTLLRRIKTSIHVCIAAILILFWTYVRATNAMPIFILTGVLLCIFVLMMRYIGTGESGTSTKRKIIVIGLCMVISLAGVVNVTTLYSFNTPENREWLNVSEWAKTNTTPGSSFIFLETGDQQTRLPYGWRAYACRGRVQLFDDALGLYYYPDLRLKKQSEGLRRYLFGRFPNKNKREIIESMTLEEWRWTQRQTQASMAIARKGVGVNLREVFREGPFVIYRMPSL
jgi:hypothetical protein